MPLQWRVPAAASLRWRSWEGEHVVYHCESGDTHLLNPAAAEALKFLETRPAGADDLAEHVAARLSLAAGGQLRREMAELLAAFDDLGLIEPVDDPARPVATGAC